VAAVQKHGCWVASNLIAHSAEGCATVLAAGGAEAVVGALRAHAGVAAVQKHGCGAMGLLAGSVEGCAAVLAAGGSEAVVGAGYLRLLPHAVSRPGGSQTNCGSGRRKYTFMYIIVPESWLY
jgi:hypothetical protein